MCTKRIRRVLRRAIFYSLPLTILAVVGGAVDGVLFSRFFTASIAAALGDLAENIAHGESQHLNRASTGADTQALATGPFYVPEIQDPRLWWEKLGLIRLDLDAFQETEPFDVEPIERLVRLDGLFKSVESGEDWHHWIYVSPQRPDQKDTSSGDDWLFPPQRPTQERRDKWDAAFSDLMQLHNANPAANNASFHSMHCPGSFLCSRWFAKGPSLLHFTTELIPKPAGPSAPSHPLKPVSVRVVEFPIGAHSDVRLWMLPKVFPSELNQLRSLTEESCAWQPFSEFMLFSQIIRRFAEYQDELGDRDWRYKTLSAAVTGVGEVPVLGHVSSAVHMLVAGLTAGIHGSLWSQVQVWWLNIANAWNINLGSHHGLVEEKNMERSQDILYVNAMLRRPLSDSRTKTHEVNRTVRIQKAS